jgi:TolA-binding protein
MKKVGFFIAILFALSACTSPKEKALKEIKAMEQNDSAFSEILMAELKEKYINFVNEYPDDEASPMFLLKASQHAIALNQANEALELLSQVSKKYPKTTFAEEAMFLEALTYENNLNDLAKAKETYELFVKTYPKAELAGEALLAIQNLGKSPEQIIEEANGKEEEN